MKFIFKTQDYQTEAVNAVTSVFSGQPYMKFAQYTRDVGTISEGHKGEYVQMSLEGDNPLTTTKDVTDDDYALGFANNRIILTDDQLLENIKNVQAVNNLKQDSSVVHKLGRVQLDIEMETGTGKTYVYIKTMFELNKKYGFSKFIVVVPSIAIREGVKKTFEQTEDNFMDLYGKKARYFIYNSAHLDQIDSFSSDSSINVMIINIQAFNTRGKDGRKIYEELDAFQSRKPIDVIRRNRPILILDEPQKMGGDATQDSIKNFDPLFTINYSATHKEHHNLVYVLDALDAYNKRLVKKIQVKGVTIKNIRGSNGYLYLQDIIVSPDKAPQVRLDFDVKNKDGSIKRNTRILDVDSNLYQLSNGLEEYKDGYTISDIDYFNNSVTFLNGETITAGEGTGDVSDEDIRRIQIRETIESHLDKEQELFDKGIKVLSLFFIDEVDKYRQYDENGEPTLGVYGKIFEEEYNDAVGKKLATLFDDTPYLNYLKGIKISDTHKGYFSIDKKGRSVDSECKRGSDISDDESAYDLILKDKERLLSFDEPTRFIFSHSALREGWDNPNVFQICTLRHTKSSIQKRQEVGRGLRLCITQSGERMDKTVLSDVFSLNKLTVIANEEYKDFVSGLQSEIKDVLYDRPTKANQAYFIGKTVLNPLTNVSEKLDQRKATKIYQYLLMNNYIDSDEHVTEQFRKDVKNGVVAQINDEEIKPFAASIVDLVEGVYDPTKIDELTENGKKPVIVDNELNSNFKNKDFQALWNAINHKYSYRVDFDSDELIKNSIGVIDRELNVSRLMYSVQEGEQKDEITKEQIESKQSFREDSDSGKNKVLDNSSVNAVKYDLIGKVAGETSLTRKTIVAILKGISPAKFIMFRNNPEEFISKVSKLINGQKASIIVEHVTYNKLDQTFDSSIFNEKRAFSYVVLNFLIFASLYVVETLIMVGISNSDNLVVSELGTKLAIPNNFGTITCYFLMMLTLFYTPKTIKTERGIVLYRLLTIIPVTMIIVNTLIYHLANTAWGWNLSIPVLNLFASEKTQFSLLCVIYLLGLYFLKLVYEKKYGKEKSLALMGGNRFIFAKNSIAALTVLLIGLIEIIFLNNKTAHTLGVGKYPYLILLSPLLLFYHPHKGERNQALDWTTLILYIIAFAGGYLLIAVPFLIIIVYAVFA